MCASVIVSVKRSSLCHLNSGTVLKVCRHFSSGRWRSATVPKSHAERVCRRIQVDQRKWQRETERQTSKHLSHLFSQTKERHLRNDTWMIWFSPWTISTQLAETNQKKIKWSCGCLRNISHSFVVFPDVFPQNDFPHYNAPLGSVVDSVRKMFSCVPCQTLALRWAC